MNSMKYLKLKSNHEKWHNATRTDSTNPVTWDIVMKSTSSQENVYCRYIPYPGIKECLSNDYRLAMFLHKLVEGYLDCVWDIERVDQIESITIYEYDAYDAYDVTLRNKVSDHTDESKIIWSYEKSENAEYLQDLATNIPTITDY